MRLLVVGTFAVRRPQAASLLELATKLVRDLGVVGGAGERTLKWSAVWSDWAAPGAAGRLRCARRGQPGQGPDCARRACRGR